MNPQEIKIQTKGYNYMKDHNKRVLDIGLQAAS